MWLPLGSNCFQESLGGSPASANTPRLLDKRIADMKYHQHLDRTIVGLRRRQALPL